MDQRMAAATTTATISALTALVAERAAGLRLYACQLLPDDPSAADDVVQEAMVSLLTLATPPPDEPVPWMYRVIRNAAFDHRRSSARRKRRERRVAEASREWFVARPAAAVIDAETAERCLAKLPAEQREIVVLRIWNGLSFAEIGTIVQRSASTVHGYYESALTQMRAVLEEPCESKTTTLSADPKPTATPR